MRIEQLTLRNINSLKGTWTIDFTDSAYAEGSLFAICGQTGAGKSSILDAICLAIYGRTPRLEVISKSQNALMNEDSNDCASELIVKVKGKRYKFSFSQKRATKGVKAGEKGNLQEAKRTIDYFDETDRVWKNLVAKKSEMKDKVGEILHLSFDQFSRSVLLAQGDFAVFLKSEQKDKSEILEQVTGTEIYSMISQRVYAKFKAVKEEKEKLEQTFDLQPVLSDEQRSEIDNNIQLCEKDLKNENVKLEQSKSELGLINKFAEQTSKLNGLQEQRKTEDLKEEGIREKKAAAQLIENCLKVKGQFESLKRCEKDHKDLLQTKNSLTVKLGEIEKSITDLTGEKSAKLLLQQRANALYSEFTQKATKAAEIDGKIGEIKSGLKKYSVKKTTTEKLLKDTEIKLKSVEEGIKSDSKLLEQIKIWIKDHKSDEKTEEEKAQLARLQESLIQKQKEAEASGEKDSKLERLITSKKSELQKNKDAVKEINESGLKLEGAIEEIKEAVKKSSEGKSYEELSNEVIGWGEELNTIERVITSQKALLEQKEEIEAIEESLKEIQKEIASLSEDREKESQALANARTLLESLEALDTINQQEKLRAELVEGKPCPVCGSTEHPYAKSLPEACKEAKQKITEAKKTIAKLEESLAGVENKLTQGKTRLEVEQKRKQKTQAGLAKNLTAFKKLAGEDKDDSEILSVVFSTELDKKRDFYTEKQKARKTLLSEIAALEKKLQIRADELKNVQKQLGDNEKLQAALTSSIKTLEEEQINVKKTTKQCEEDLALLIANFSETYSGQNAIKTVPEALESIQELLKNASKYVEKTTNADSLSNALEVKTVSQKNLRQEKNKSDEELAALGEEIRAAEGDLAQKQNERIALVGEVVLEEHRKELEQKLKKASEDYQSVSEKLAAADKQKTEVQTSIQEKSTALEKNSNEIEVKSKEWEEERNKLALTDDAQYVAALEKSRDLDEYQREIQAFETKKIEDRKLIESLNEEIKALEQKVSALNPKEKIEERINELTQAVKEKSEELGRNKERLESDNRSREKRREVKDQLEKLDESYSLWNQLSNMIGSENGAKYRTFVQSLTLEVLLKYANKFLQSLNNRYILAPDKESLNLFVIDKDLGSERRPTDNLSGGETFLISLALSLALSEMASNNVKIDSLFLDEGFGSLDEASLEKALSTLMQLSGMQGISTEGKLVGVISHIQRVKDAIPVQIEVKVHPRGKSSLSGPGVSQRAE